MARIGGYLVALALVTFLVVVGGPNFTNSPAWAHRTTHSIVWETNNVTSISEEIHEPLTQVGLTWDGTAPTFAAVRLLREGQWGPWLAMTLTSDHGPDLNTAEYIKSKDGTDLIWTEPADGAQFMVTGNVAAQATLIDTTNRSKPLSKRLSDVFAPTQSAHGAPSQPNIQPRTAWDPSGSCQPKAEPGYVQVTHAFVHHTTGPNNYTDPAARVLAICLFHTQSRGWDDIGYNFLIDRFGTIWEGRDGGIAKGVQGAHSAGFNSYSTGIAFIGEHSDTAPSAAAGKALEDLLAWKFGVHNVEPVKSSVLYSKGSAKWPEGTPVTMKPVSGHRDAQATSCPGDACYQRIPTYRSGIEARWSQVPLGTYKSPLSGDFDGDGQIEGAVFRSTDGVWALVQPYGTVSAWANFSTGSGWVSQLPGDFNGDGKDDIANYHSGTGKWMISLSTGSGFSTTKWEEFNTKTGWTSQIGDFNGDGKDDIANYHSGTGKWMISLSTGSGFSTTKWEEFNTKTGWTSQIGDFNGDGKDDIANYHSGTGNWVVASSSGTDLESTVWAHYQTPDHMSYIIAVDTNGNGREELLAVDAYNGFLIKHSLNGSGFDLDIVDTPWRIHLAGNPSALVKGSAYLVFFGQQFEWILLTGLDTGSPEWDLIATMARP